MKFRDARKLKEGDLIVESETKNIYIVVSIEVFMDAKQVRIYAKINSKDYLASIFYNKEVEPWIKNSNT